ncbi:MAG: calcium/sodium antiporter [Pseudomonadota bacterium]|nr:MAG: calcium/sodium antiporter [Pseudomonadota bacterium]
MLLAGAAVVTGFALLLWGADRFVFGASATADRLGVSPLIIGLTIVGFGTSAPEMIVSAVAAWQGNSGIAVGNAIGSNIANIALVLGTTAVVCPLVVRSETLRREYPLMFLVMLLALVLLLDGQLSRIDGVVLLAGLALMGYWVVRIGKRKSREDPLTEEFDHEIPHTSMTRALLWLAAGLVLLLASSRLLVWGAVNLAQAIGVSDLIIGLSVVAIGTSLPELAASLVSALRKEPDIAIGNVIGSNIFNLLAVLGLPGVIAPLSLAPEVLQRDYPVMIALTVALFVMAFGFRGDGRITRIEGVLLLLAYAGYATALYLATAV